MKRYKKPTEALTDMHDRMVHADDKVAFLCKDVETGHYFAVRAYIPEDCTEFFDSPNSAIVCYFTAADVQLLASPALVGDPDQTLADIAAKVAMPIGTFPLSNLLTPDTVNKEPS